MQRTMDGSRKKTTNSMWNKKDGSESDENVYSDKKATIYKTG